MTHTDYSRPVKDFAIAIHTMLKVDQTIEEAIESLRMRKIDEKVIYFYVVDDSERLQGVVPTRTLLLKDPRSSIADVMKKGVISLKETQTLQEAIELLASHHLLALPVVDEELRLKGAIDIQLYLEETIDLADARHSHDVFQILGLTLEEGKQRTPWKSYRIRMPWILCNMVGGVACAVISWIFELVLAKFLLLAMFIPLILTLSESISMQSMTQSLHLVRHPKISWRKVFERVFIEGRMVLLLSSTCGVTVGLVSLLWGGGVMASLTIAVSLLVSISVSASIGASIPLLLHAKQLDPKVASGPVVLMFADVITTLIYLSLATWWLI
ncbi:MAG: magnesium transporter [Rhabdochlamydiaceae bacterium]|nr:magnesium transporter [Rhabdochlamydiaceae bacterium]